MCCDSTDCIKEPTGFSLTDTDTDMMLTLLLIVTFTDAVTEAARILCPNEPIEAEIGEDVRLPCLLDPGLDLSDLTVDWTRVNDSKVVFSYRSRMINDIDQLEQYRNRTRLSREDLSVGNMELQMFSAQLSDSGRYRKWTDQSQHPVICVTLRGQRSLFTLPLYVSVFKHHLPIQGLQM
ncbi:myelin-oligodendrocyte glycoprotein-like [Mastacembelus armatus]|uniref:myelin-oligodendrocyte glycoprotein-like n=1 Tax=Mastacembelus armatus TaxID=205130 RepID=UPI001436A7A2|nr:myelin-oligodendrocyte glycoprotein-like [Mastacembelus armatus]